MNFHELFHAEHWSSGRVPWSTPYDRAIQPRVKLRKLVRFARENHFWRKKPADFPAKSDYVTSAPLPQGWLQLAGLLYTVFKW